MGIVSDIINGFVAVVATVIGQVIATVIVKSIHFPFFSIILAVVGLFVAGFGLRRRGMVAAVIVGIGLGLAASVEILVSSGI